MSQPVQSLSEFDRGLIVGILVSEGSFGGDGKQPHVSLRLHVRHERLLRRLVAALPGTRLYGPYHHGGRDYFQWMARGDTLAVEVLPLLEEAATLDDHAAARLAELKEKYGGQLARAQRRQRAAGRGDDPDDVA